MRVRDVVWMGVLGAWCLPGDVDAQSLGTFRWQMQPYCNVVTLEVTQTGSGFRLEGTDDQCGGGTDRASAIGTAFQNPDGTIGMGLTLVLAPGGAAVHVDVALAPGGFSGTWRDSSGLSGPFALTAGHGTGGERRPLPALGGAIRLGADGGFVAEATGTGTSPASGAGDRMMWHAGKAAFRAGTASADAWDDAQVGRNSVAAGKDSIASGNASTALGLATEASGSVSTALGFRSRATGHNSLAAGDVVLASGYASVALGYGTVASGFASTALGDKARASGDSSLAAGLLAVANGARSIALGSSASAFGSDSVALGSNVIAHGTARGSFVFGDASSPKALESVTPNQFLARFAGGIVFWSTKDPVYPTSPGVQLAPGGSAWSSLSDVNSKEHFRDIDGAALLDTFATLPIRTWSYKAQDAAIRHAGPTAQDFHAAFGLGEDARRISTIDADGIALAGVKALEARTRALLDRASALERDNLDLRMRLEQLERLLDRR